MSSFEVLLHGVGLRLETGSGEVGEGGVYTWQMVTANCEEEAVAKARLAALNDPYILVEILNSSLDEISFSVEEVRVVPFLDPEKIVAPVLYSDTTEDETERD
jgi:hypothetical protein